MLAVLFRGCRMPGTWPTQDAVGTTYAALAMMLCGCVIPVFTKVMSVRPKTSADIRLDEKSFRLPQA